MPINDELVALCLTPIPGDAPSGADLRYDVRLDAIKEDRREEKLPGSDQKFADWPTVVAKTSTLLQKETKDLQLAGWMTEALLRQQSFGGLATGLAVVCGLLEEFWETVHPEIEDGDLELRVGPLEWIAEKLTLPVRLAPAIGRYSCTDLDSAREVPTEDAAKESKDARALRDKLIENGYPTPEEIDAARAGLTKVWLRASLADIATAIEQVDTLDKTGDEKFGNLAPSYSSLRTALDEPRRILQGLLTQRLIDDPDPIEEVSAEGDGVAGLDPDAPQTPEPVSVADASQRIAMVTRWLRQQDPTNPSPYLVVRGHRWGELRAHAPELDPRLLDAPPTATRTRLKALLLDGKWPELLEQGEALMSTSAGRGWLDLQRYTLTACANLGSAYHPVAAVIRSELRALLTALPQLSRMMLMDDTPTANDETREWLDGEIMANASPDADADADADAPDTRQPSDGSELLEAALVDDDATATMGGFGAARAPHPSAVHGQNVFSAALGELKRNRPQRAIELLMRELTRDQSPRGRFLRQTQIAYIMVEAGLDKVAEPILRQLVELIDERKLEQWEAGPLVAQPLSLLLRVLERSETDSSLQTTLYLRVCRLDPIQALALKAH